MLLLIHFDFFHLYITNQTLAERHFIFMCNYTKNFINRASYSCLSKQKVMSLKFTLSSEKLFTWELLPQIFPIQISSFPIYQCTFSPVFNIIITPEVKEHSFNFKSSLDVTILLFFTVSIFDCSNFLYNINLSLTFVNSYLSIKFLCSEKEISLMANPILNSMQAFYLFIISSVKSLFIQV